MSLSLFKYLHSHFPQIIPTGIREWDFRVPLGPENRLLLLAQLLDGKHIHEVTWLQDCILQSGLNQILLHITFTVTIHQLPRHQMQLTGVYEMLNRSGGSGVDHVVADFSFARMEGGADMEDCLYAVKDALAI